MESGDLVVYQGRRQEGKQGCYCTDSKYFHRILSSASCPLMTSVSPYSKHANSPLQQMAAVISPSGELNTDRWQGNGLLCSLKRKLIMEIKQMDGTHAETGLFQ